MLPRKSVTIIQFKPDITEPIFVKGFQGGIGLYRTLLLVREHISPPFNQTKFREWKDEDIHEILVKFHCGCAGFIDISKYQPTNDENTFVRQMYSLMYHFMSLCFEHFTQYEPLDAQEWVNKTYPDGIPGIFYVSEAYNKYLAATPTTITCKHCHHITHSNNDTHKASI